MKLIVPRCFLGLLNLNLIPILFTFYYKFKQEYCIGRIIRPLTNYYSTTAIYSSVLIKQRPCITVDLDFGSQNCRKLVQEQLLNVLVHAAAYLLHTVHLGCTPRPGPSARSRSQGPTGGLRYTPRQLCLPAGPDQNPTETCWFGWRFSEN